MTNKNHLEFFKSTVDSIPKKKWEESVGIGSFLDVKIEKVYTRPFSFIAKCTLTGDIRIKNIYIKLYRDYYKHGHKQLREKVESEYRTTLIWYNAFKPSEKYNVVKPILAIPDKYIFVTEETRGLNLHQVALGIQLINELEQVVVHGWTSPEIREFPRCLQSLPLCRHRPNDED